MEISRLKSLLESLIFVAETPLKNSEMLKAVRALERQEGQEDSEESGEVLEEKPDVEVSEGEEADAAEQLQAKADEEAGRVSLAEINQALRELDEEYQTSLERGIILVEVAGGWQFRTRPENAAVIRYFYQPKPTRLSKPGMETLSIVAYRQPITRAEIDDIRGVDSGGVLKTLCEKNLVRIVGKKEEPGKPMLYGTTQDFLELFQLKNLKELPTLKDFRDLEEQFQKQSQEEGVRTEVEDDEEAEVSILELSQDNALMPLNEEEEEILEDLEENIKEVRQLEKDIFHEDKKEAAEENPSPDGSPN